VFDLPVSLNQEVARGLLANPETDALSALLAMSCFLQDDVLDEDGQPYLEYELREMLDAAHVRASPENITRVCGLLHAIAGDEFLDTVVHFLRMLAAIVEGDAFAYEDDQNEPSLADMYWGLYLAGLLAEDDLLAEIGPRVERYIQRTAEDEAEDSDALQQFMDEQGDSPEQLESYTDELLSFRRRLLATNLTALGCKSEWVSDLDPDLAQSMDEAQS
jgi:hypothetical protein